MQNLAVVVVNINPKIRLVIAGSQIQCLVESCAVFPERAAWPCEGVYWIQSDYPVLSLGCTYFHRSPRWLGSSLSTLASARKQAERPCASQCRSRSLLANAAVQSPHRNSTT